MQPILEFVSSYYPHLQSRKERCTKILTIVYSLAQNDDNNMDMSF